MLKVKLRNTRENLPTIDLTQLDPMYSSDNLDDGDQITLRLVNAAGITFDTTFTAGYDDDGNLIGKADGWNTYGLPLQRNNKPFELGVCALEEGDTIHQSFGGKTDSEDDFEEFEETDEADDFEEFEEEEVAPKRVAASRGPAPAATVTQKKAPTPTKPAARASKTPYANALKKHGTQAAAARALGIGVDAFRYRLKKEQGY